MVHRRWVIGARGLGGAAVGALCALAPGDGAALRDHGPDGLWLHGTGARAGALARAWAAGCGRSLRRYEVEVREEAGGFAVRSEGATVTPEGEERPIRGAVDAMHEPGPGAPEALAEHALAVVLEVNEALGEDYSVRPV